jgi:hypothetical protein
MRPDDPRPGFDDLMDPGMDLPFDADLEALDEELSVAGDQARRMLYGRMHPTRVFSNQLRARLLGQVALPAASANAAGDVALPLGPDRGSRLRTPATPGEAWAPTALAPRIARRTPTILPRARWSVLAAASLAGVLVVGALGANLDWLEPSPTQSAAPSAALRSPAPDATRRPIVAVESSDPTEQPEPTKKPKPEPTRTPRPDPTKTPRPDPTDPPIGPMDLVAKACPGGVVLDWSKPSTAIGHYHTLRALDGSVAASYPGGGTEIDSATTWDAGTTDAFDASLGGGKTATYRTFAFDGDDHVIAYSQPQSVGTIDRLDITGFAWEQNGAGTGSITFSWTSPSINAGCFSYGKLVASAEDPDPSYLKGAATLQVISDLGTNEVTVEKATGTTAYVRYQLIRATSTGKFVVAQTDVLEVTFP